MANIKSAKKRINVAIRQKDENKIVKSKIATWIKKFKNAVATGDKEQAAKLYSETTALLDSAVSKNIIHKGNADRKKARLAVHLNKQQNI